MKKLFTNTLALMTGALLLMSCDIPTANSPSQLTLTTIADKNANRGLPTAIRIYALSSDHLFYGYDYFSLKLDGDSVLDVTLKGVLDEISVEPGETIVVGPYDIPKNTNYIGVVADFKNIERARWRDVIDVRDRGANEQIYIVVKGNTVTLVTKADYEKALANVQAQIAEQQAQKAEADAKKAQAEAAK